MRACQDLPGLAANIEHNRANTSLMLTLQVPGIYKIRYIGQTTLSSAAVSKPFSPVHTLLCKVFLHQLADVLADIWLVPRCWFSAAVWARVLTSTARHMVPPVCIHMTELSRCIQETDNSSPVAAQQNLMQISASAHMLYAFLSLCQASKMPNSGVGPARQSIRTAEVAL